jgi:lipopolysaccharide transport system permease protein
MAQYLLNGRASSFGTDTNGEVMANLKPGARRPDAQVIVIEPRHGWRDLGISELWAHRELLYYFVWRDLKVRYKQTLFGAAWALLQPVLLMIVFSVSLGRIPGVGPAGVPYPLFLFAGLVPWTLFSQSLIGASNSLVSGEAIITKVYFPRLLLPFSAVGSFILDFVIAFVVLLVLMFAFGIAPTLSILWVPALTLMAIVTALGIGTFLAAVNVRYRDVKYVVPFLVQLWLFASPVVYTSSLIPDQWRTLYSLNPMAGVVEGFRWAIIGGPRPDDVIVVSAAASVLMLVGGLLYFRRVERTFADVI